MHSINNDIALNSITYLLAYALLLSETEVPIGYLLFQYWRPIFFSVLYNCSSKNNVTEQLIMNFAWSLKPIFIWLTICTGLDFDRSEKRKHIGRWFLRVNSLLLFIFFITISNVTIVGIIIDLKNYHNSTKQDLESHLGFENRKIAWILIYILLVAFQLSVVVSAFGKWKPLWEKMELVQLNLSFPATYYRRLRRETSIGLILLSTVIPSHSY